MFSNSCLNLAKVGEHLILKSRVGNFRIFLYDGSNTGSPDKPGGLSI